MLQRMGVVVVESDLLRMAGQAATGKIRHDSGAIAAVAIELASEARERKRKRSL
jgi:hypothetical protein